MAAAYAAVVSFLNTMDQIHNHLLLSTFVEEYRCESLCEMVDFFLDFVENYSDAGSREAEYLFSRIALAVQRAEDMIECAAGDWIIAASTEQDEELYYDLMKIADGMDYIREEITKLKEETGFITRHPTYSMMTPAFAKTTAMVGFEAYSEQLLDQLTGQQSDRRIIPIVGMGGIGKTTLARNVYENLLTVHHFDVRAWVTISQEFSERQILLQALSCLGESTSEMERLSDFSELGEKLSKNLYGRRYMIVLDDVWSVEAWENIMFFFPENNNGSRIVVTTRQRELVDYFGSTALAIDFLDDKNSWELFCENTFGQKGCPHPELEKVGKRIVKKCKGLPLAITMIGGLLGKSSRVKELWIKTAKDMSSIFDSGEGNKVLNILNLSYKHLPVYLKVCFLYLGLFPEDDYIHVSQLIKLWIAEGLIKPKLDQSLEEVAESYIKELVDRNLLLVSRWSEVNKKFRGFRVHDLVRDLCVKIAEKENLFSVERSMDGSRRYIVEERMARFYLGDREYHPWKTPSIIHPLILFGNAPGPFKSRLLRVVRDIGDLSSTCQEVSLRFLYHEPHFAGLDRTPTYKLPSSVSLLWRLQTLIVSQCKLVVPCEIWKMPQLRHIDITPVFLLTPPLSDDVFVLRNLQTLETVQNLIFSEEVCRRMPNIKELSIDYQDDESGKGSPCYNLQSVGCFDKLESLGYIPQT